MKKNSIIIIFVAIIILATGVGAWKWKSKQNMEISRDKIKQEQTQSESQQFQQIPEDQLVWYEIPEFGIRFKVTPDAKEDLKYVIENGKALGIDIKTETAYLYLQSVHDFLGEKRCISSSSCSDFAIWRMSRKEYEEQKKKEGFFLFCDTPVIQNEKYSYCLSGNQQAPLFNSREQARQYADILKEQSKNLGFFQHYEFGSRIESTYRPFAHIEFIEKSK